jgi:DNA mismatch endonuclease (patch repair protein)
MTHLCRRPRRLAFDAVGHNVLVDAMAGVRTSSSRRVSTATVASVADFLDPATRSRVMARIGSKDTKPELALSAALHAAGLRGWRLHRTELPGKPDLAWVGRHVAVFVDGRFWHGHPDYFTFGKSGAYWDAKIARTQERDRQATAALEAQGWTVLRFWDFQVEQEPLACVERIAEALALTSSFALPSSPSGGG